MASVAKLRRGVFTKRVPGQRRAAIGRERCRAQQEHRRLAVAQGELRQLRALALRTRRDHDRHLQLVDPRRQEAQPCHRSAIRPVRIVDHEQERTAVGQDSPSASTARSGPRTGSPTRAAPRFRRRARTTGRPDPRCPRATPNAHPPATRAAAARTAVARRHRRTPARSRRPAPTAPESPRRGPDRADPRAASSFRFRRHPRSSPRPRGPPSPVPATQTAHAARIHAPATRPIRGSGLGPPSSSWSRGRRAHYRPGRAAQRGQAFPTSVAVIPVPLGSDQQFGPIVPMQSFESIGNRT